MTSRFDYFEPDVPVPYNQIKRGAHTWSGTLAAGAYQGLNYNDAYAFIPYAKADASGVVRLYAGVRYLTTSWLTGGYINNLDSVSHDCSMIYYRLT